MDVSVRLPDIEGNKALVSEVEWSKRQRIKGYPIGLSHIDIAEVQTAEGGLHLSVGIVLGDVLTEVYAYARARRVN